MAEGLNKYVYNTYKKKLILARKVFLNYCLLPKIMNKKTTSVQLNLLLLF